MMKTFVLPTLAAFATIIACMSAPASAQVAAPDCSNASEVAQLPAFERGMVEQVLASKRESACRDDACEFHVEHMADGRYLVKMRARRPRPDTASCVTVWMSEEAYVFDATGRAVDIWPYCFLMAHEASLAKPAFKPDPLPYEACKQGPAG
jgi:hypothetical protein